MTGTDGAKIDGDRHRAIEIVDAVLQRVVATLYALECDRPDLAAERARVAAATARAGLAALLAEAGPVAPGDLARTPAVPPAQPVAGRAGARVLLVDDAADLRALVRIALEADGEFAVVGEAGDGRQAVGLAADLQPDAVVLDLAMPGMDGLQALPLLRAAAPAARIVVLSGVAADHAAVLATALGADGYLEKGEAVDALAAVLRTLLPQPDRR